MNPGPGRAIPHDMYNQPHNDCMRKGTGGKYYTGGKQVYVNEKSHDLHEYMRRHAKLEGKDWILYVDDKRTGFVIDREVVV